MDNDMNNNSKDFLWPLFIILGSVPGVIIWLLLVRLGLAGEFAGLIIGFGAATVVGYYRCKITKRRIILGSLILVIIAFLSNHLAYSMDIYFTFSAEWYGIVGEELTFVNSIGKAWKFMVLENIEDMRKFYFEAWIQGALCSLLVWVASNLYRLVGNKEEMESGTRD